MPVHIWMDELYCVIFMCCLLGRSRLRALENEIAAAFGCGAFLETEEQYLEKHIPAKDIKQCK